MGRPRQALRRNPPSLTIPSAAGTLVPWKALAKWKPVRRGKRWGSQRGEGRGPPREAPTNASPSTRPNSSMFKRVGGWEEGGARE